MSYRKLVVPTVLAIVGVAVAAASVATADQKRDDKADAKAGQPEIKLPPGWTMEDMQACVAAGTPGKMHEHLAKGVGVWQGKNTMWMAPGADPVTSDCTYTATAIMDGRYVKGEWAGEMPGMGPYHGFGINGFDNVAQKFVSTWIDNHSTGIMNGVGELSGDGRTMTWNFTYHCPMTRKPAVMRQVETTTAPGKKMLEMFGTDPKSGKEYKMMRIEFARK